MAWLEVDSNQKSLINLDQIQSISCTKAGSKLPNGHPLQRARCGGCLSIS